MNSLFKLRNWLKGELIFGKNLCRLGIEPISDFNRFLDFRSLKPSTAWVFQTNGVMPPFPIQKPSHSHSVFASSHFRTFKAAFDTSSFLRFFSTNAMCYFKFRWIRLICRLGMRSLEEIP